MNDYGIRVADPVLVPATIRGYRAWRTLVATPTLGAVTWSTMWSPGRNEAHCGKGGQAYFTRNADGEAVVERNPTHGIAPSPECVCGFYARHSDDLHGYAANYICGVIKASGQIVLGTKGFRAQYAEIEALYLTPGTRASAGSSWVDIPWSKNIEEGCERLAERYGVPIIRGSFRDVIKQYPPDDLTELLGKMPERIGTIPSTSVSITGSLSINVYAPNGQQIFPPPPIIPSLPPLQPSSKPAKITRGPARWRKRRKA